MSPGLTTERIYDTLKRQIMHGDRSPGERLDPVKLAGELNASATPVREALHRLLGERMVQAWPQDGFHVPVHSEVDLRDLYAWNLDLLSMILRSALAPQSQVVKGDDVIFERGALSDHASQVAILFHVIAAGSGNFEHRRAVTQVNDRLHVARRVEPQLIDDVDAELDAITVAWKAQTLNELRRLLGSYHKRRLRKIHRIAAFLRPMSNVVGA